MSTSTSTSINTPADKTVVSDPNALTPEEKKVIEDKVKAVNPGSTVVVTNNGTTTVTTPSGKTAVIPGVDLTKTEKSVPTPNAGNDIVKPADKTVVSDPNALTPEEKKVIEDKVKAVNPGSTVVVANNGTTTVTTPSGKTAVIPGVDLTKTEKSVPTPNAGNDIVKPADKTVVSDPNALTPEEKKVIEDKVKAVNPGSTVVVTNNGTTTVTTPSGKTAVIPGVDLTKTEKSVPTPNAGNDIVKPADKTVVSDPNALTPEEKKVIEDKVKAVNPGSTVVVTNNGTTTVTTPSGKTAVIPGVDLTKTEKSVPTPNAGNDIVKPADKTVVSDPNALTPEEKKVIEDKVKAVNPGSTVVVTNNGTTTVTTPSGKTAVIPGVDLTKTEKDVTKPNAGNDIVTPADKTVVSDPNALTPEEKKVIEDKVKAVNPGSIVVVTNNGTTTVTTPSGKTAVIPGVDLTKSGDITTRPNEGNDIVTPADKTVVSNPDALTPEEKKVIEDKVKAVNPGSTVVVDDKGNATVTTPSGKTAVIPGADLTKTEEDVMKPSTAPSESESTLASTSADTLSSETPSESAGKSRQQLPNTGTKASKSSVLLGALAAVTGLGLFAKRRKRDDEE
ncbi:LPXTG cell wall anchor domain-containing protein [Streptococcus humanilactis]|uniref:LPXTG cell wall anchor domain-containing protein n=1 Tax=Streptococcus humanilactis TaxID=2841061 RepID=UPI0028158CD6|nr:LPXTG cell wall anchor domain-containing protein [Streptococcus humanilactis]